MVVRNTVEGVTFIITSFPHRNIPLLRCTYAGLFTKHENTINQLLFGEIGNDTNGLGGW